jgi:hypothetical protein
MEVATWNPAVDRLAICLERPGQSQGSIDLSLPQPPRKARLEQEDIIWETIGEQLYRFPVQFNRRAMIELDWERS